MQEVVNKVPQVATGGSMVTVEVVRVILAQAVAAMEVVVAVGLQGRVAGGQGEEHGELVGQVEKIVGPYV